MRLRLSALLACVLLVACSAGGGSGVSKPTGQGGGAGSSGAAGDASVNPDTSVIDTGLDDTQPETTIVEGGYDAPPKPDATQCSDAPPPAAQISTGLCAAATDDECNGSSDPADMQGHTIPNGVFGNGFDDDCDGLVDEGCNCDPAHQVGATKECFLMPSSWVDDATKLPTGWCAENSKGTVKCISKGGNPEQPIREWDGECRGAQPPSNDDACAIGDFNCDGVQMNPLGKDCACVEVPVTCPTEPLLMNPFPDQNDLTAKDVQNPLIGDTSLPFLVDGNDWVLDSLESQVTQWKWTLTGGDCDNILPHPTFAIYPQKASSSGMIGQQNNTLGSNGNQHGYETTPADGQHQIFPAFSLSGDYIVKSEFDLQGTHYECTVKVQVRAPGIRAELCWDTVGGNGSNDVDIHFARLQGNASCANHGWFLPCGDAPNADDCYYSSSSGCTSGDDPGWGYPNSNMKACHGWGSLRGDPGLPDTNPCTNPRLDRDNISCMPSVKDPNGGLFSGEFCGPENVNHDKPKVGDRFVVGAQCYACVNGSHPKTHPHINIYCHGARKYSAGYDPSVPGEQYPALVESGADDGGSMWEAVVVTWKGDLSDPCQIDPIPSTVPNPSTDGTNQVCVDNGPKNQGSATIDAWQFTATGAYPTSTDPMCWH
jgi:hypothetical protein